MNRKTFVTARVHFAILCFIALAGLPPAQGDALKSDEQLMLFPSLAAVVDEGRQVEIEVRGWIFEPEQRAITLAALRKMLGISTEDLSGDALEIFTKRADPFLYDNERGKRVMLNMGAVSDRSGRSGANGHFSATLRMPYAGGSELPLLSAHIGTGRAPVTLNVVLLSDQGLSVISDIDDTIKVSEVTDRKALLQNTFLKEFSPVEGMADLYRSWAEGGAQFHYVTASPWQLYLPLAEFIQTNGFPAGTFHMKTFRFKDRTFFDLFSSPVQYKLEVIQPLLQRFPRRRFLLVGDSGEQDPEIYGQLARRYPTQVAGIYIRDLTNAEQVGARYAVAFEGLPASLWRVFRDPGAVQAESSVK